MKEGQELTGYQSSYTYRDPSMGEYWQHNPMIVDKRQQFFWRRRLVKLLFLLLPFLWGFLLYEHYGAVYATYQKGTCAITSIQVQEYDSTDKYGAITRRSYRPVLSYIVFTTNDHQVNATGFDGPSSKSYATFDEALAMVSQYSFEQRVSCWYDPAKPTHAFLVFYGYQSGSAAFIFFGNSIGFGLFSLTLYFLFDWATWRLYALARRGVLTQGTVIRNELRRAQSKSYTVSILAFQPVETPGRQRFKTRSGKIPPGQMLPICYDPFYPRYSCFGSWPDRAAYLAGAVILGFLCSFALIIMLFEWLML